MTMNNRHFFVHYERILGICENYNIMFLHFWKNITTKYLYVLNHCKQIELLL